MTKINDPTLVRGYQLRMLLSYLELKNSLENNFKMNLSENCPPPAFGALSPKTADGRDHDMQDLGDPCLVCRSDNCAICMRCGWEDHD